MSITRTEYYESHCKPQKNEIERLIDAVCIENNDRNKIELAKKYLHEGFDRTKGENEYFGEGDGFFSTSDEHIARNMCFGIIDTIDIHNDQLGRKLEGLRVAGIDIKDILEQAIAELRLHKKDHFAQLERPSVQQPIVLLPKVPPANLKTAREEMLEKLYKRENDSNRILSSAYSNTPETWTDISDRTGKYIVIPGKADARVYNTGTNEAGEYLPAYKVVNKDGKKEITIEELLPASRAPAKSHLTHDKAISRLSLKSTNIKNAAGDMIYHREGFHGDYIVRGDGTVFFTGGFHENKGKKFFLEPQTYINDCWYAGKIEVKPEKPYLTGLSYREKGTGKAALDDDFTGIPTATDLARAELQAKRQEEIAKAKTQFKQTATNIEEKRNEEKAKISKLTETFTTKNKKNAENVKSHASEDNQKKIQGAQTEFEKAFAESLKEKDPIKAAKNVIEANKKLNNVAVKVQAEEEAYNKILSKAEENTFEKVNSTYGTLQAIKTNWSATLKNYDVVMNDKSNLLAFPVRNRLLNQYAQETHEYKKKFDELAPFYEKAFAKLEEARNAKDKEVALQKYNEALEMFKANAHVLDTTEMNKKIAEAHAKFTKEAEDFIKVLNVSEEVIRKGKEEFADVAAEVVSKRTKIPKEICKLIILTKMNAVENAGNVLFGNKTSDQAWENALEMFSEDCASVVIGRLVETAIPGKDDKALKEMVKKLVKNVLKDGMEEAFRQAKKENPDFPEALEKIIKKTLENNFKHFSL